MALAATESYQEQPPTDGMARVVGVGGLLSVKTQWPFYNMLLSDPDSPLSVKDRFLPIPDRGLSTFPEMYGQLEEQLRAVHERLGERFVLLGQSMGGLMVTKLGLENPDMISDVVCLAGVHDGVDEFTLAGKALKYLLGSPDNAENLLADSDMMIGHRHDMATRWSEDVSLHLFTPTHDLLIPAPRGLEVALPNKRQPKRNIIVPLLPGLSFGIREKTQHLDNVTELRPLLPVEHIDIAISLPVVGAVRRIRQSAAMAMNGLITLPSIVAEPLPLAA